MPAVAYPLFHYFNAAVACLNELVKLRSLGRATE